MKSLATLLNLSTTLSQNITGANQLFMLQMLSDRHRYSIQKYFDNERSFQTTTVGGMNLTLTAPPSAGATTATLTAAWTYPTVSQYGNFSDGDERYILFTNGSTAISWVGGLTNNSTTALTTVGVQRYLIPAVISKVTNDTVNVGQLRYVPAPIMTRQEWDLINFLPYTSDIPNYFFIYNGAMELWPIPSTTGNLITFNYKARVPDFSTAFLFSSTSGAAFVPGQTAFDYQNGSLTGIATGSTSITGSGTSWNTTGKFPLNTDVSFYNLYLNIGAPGGDGIWYPISQFNSDTSLTLALPIVNAPSSTTATHGYAIGQLPLLSEDFHDMLPYDSLRTYFASIVENEAKYKMFSGLYDERLALLEAYAGSKTVNVDLQATPLMTNPNLFFNGTR
jgi:hypothetical protein